MSLKYIKNITYLKSLLSTLPYSARPMKINNCWRSPQFSKRRLALLRKSADICGIPWPLPDPVKPEPIRHGFLKHPKGSVHFREQNKRIDAINLALQGNANRLEKIREEARKARYKDMITDKLKESEEKTLTYADRRRARKMERNKMSELKKLKKEKSKKEDKKQKKK